MCSSDCPTSAPANRPNIRFVVALSNNNAIGKDNKLPWHLPSDLAFFKQQTLGMPIIMGRNTWQSIGRILPGRLNVVISRASRDELKLPDAAVLVSSIEDALAACKDCKEVAIIGGAQLFNATLSIADVVILNRIQTHIEDADVFFPELSTADWRLDWSESVPADEKNAFAQERQRWLRKDNN